MGILGIHGDSVMKTEKNFRCIVNKILIKIIKLIINIILQNIKST